MLLYCTNKKCGKYQEGLLDLADNNVYCAECNQVIDGISDIFKYQLKQLKQVKKKTEKKDPAGIVFKCESCNSTMRPRVDKTLTAYCTSCNNKMTNVPHSFLHALTILNK